MTIDRFSETGPMDYAPKEDPRDGDGWHGNPNEDGEDQRL